MFPLINVLNIVHMARNVIVSLTICVHTLCDHLPLHDQTY